MNATFNHAKLEQNAWKRKYFIIVNIEPLRNWIVYKNKLHIVFKLDVIKKLDIKNLSW